MKQVLSQGHLAFYIYSRKQAGPPLLGKDGSGVGAKVGLVLEERRFLLERGKELSNWEGMLVRDWPESRGLFRKKLRVPACLACGVAGVGEGDDSGMWVAASCEGMSA